MAGLIHNGIASFGHGVVAWAQFSGATFLSAILDNNIVADFASRALGGFDLQTLHLFAMAQIAGTRSAAAGRTSGRRNRSSRIRSFNATSMRRLRRCSGSGR